MGLTMEFDLRGCKSVVREFYKPRMHPRQYQKNQWSLAFRGDKFLPSIFERLCANKRHGILMLCFLALGGFLGFACLLQASGCKDDYQSCFR